MSPHPVKELLLVVGDTALWALDLDGEDPSVPDANDVRHAFRLRHRPLPLLPAIDAQPL
jgi:hypothetical protein